MAAIFDLSITPTSESIQLCPVVLLDFKNGVTVDNRGCKRNVSNDEISRSFAIIAHYGEPAIVNSEQRSRQDGVEHLLLVKLCEQ